MMHDIERRERKRRRRGWRLFHAVWISALLASSLFLATHARGDDTLTDGQDQLAHIPWTSGEDIARSPFGVSTHDGATPDGEYPTARQEIRENYYGNGILIKDGDGRIIDCISRHNYVGARLGSSDSEIRGCRLYNNRDVCLWIARDAGNCQSTQNHCYGARIACFNGGTWYRAVNDTYADALVGYWGDGGECVLTNILFQHDKVRCALLRGGDQHLMNCVIKVQREVKINFFSVPGMQVYTGCVGAELGDDSSVRGGLVSIVDWKNDNEECTGKPSEGLWVVGDSVVIDTHLSESDNVDGTVAIRTKGPRKGLYVNCNVTGFQSPKDRILVVEDAAHTTGLDITLRINGLVKPVKDYIDIGAGWTGSITLIDTAKGESHPLVKGRAY